MHHFPGRAGWRVVDVCGLTLLQPAGSQGATRKYKVWMRHRYRSCCNRLQELLTHPSFEVKVSLADLRHSMHPQLWLSTCTEAGLRLPASAW